MTQVTPIRFGIAFAEPPGMSRSASNAIHSGLVGSALSVVPDDFVLTYGPHEKTKGKMQLKLTDPSGDLYMRTMGFDANVLEEAKAPEWIAIFLQHAAKAIGGIKEY